MSLKPLPDPLYSHRGSSTHPNISHSHLFHVSMLYPSPSHMSISSKSNSHPLHSSTTTLALPEMQLHGSKQSITNTSYRRRERTSLCALSQSKSKGYLLSCHQYPSLTKCDMPNNEKERGNQSGQSCEGMVFLCREVSRADPGVLFRRGMYQGSFRPRRAGRAGEGQIPWDRLEFVVRTCCPACGRSPCLGHFLVVAEASPIP